MRFTFRLLLLLIFVIGVAAFAQEEDDSGLLPITEDTNYVVRTADTLDAIGALFDVSPSCIADTNEITDLRTIYPGDSLLISVSCPVYGGDPRDMAESEVLYPREVVTFEDDCDGYRVFRNDSIDMIGFNLNVSAVSIAVANELEPPYVIEVNQCLIIPEDAPPYGVYPALQTASGDLGTGGALPPGEIYVLQPRETLDVVGQRLNVSVVAIMLTNNISDARTLQPGTSFVIPDDAPPYGMYPAIYEPLIGQLYTVRAGESLDNIAEAFDVAVIAIEVANEVETGRTPQIGTTIVIPYNAPAYGMDADFDAAMLGQGGGIAGITHVVQPREALDLIAAYYGISTRCLLETNQIKNGKQTQPGTVLIIADSCGPYLGADGRPDLSNVMSPAASEETSETDAEATDSEEETTEAQPQGG